MDDFSRNLSILIPCRNETQTIEQVLIRTRKALPFSEVWVIDGGSDDTKEKVLKLQRDWADLHYYPNEGDRGKGHAIRAGIQIATRPWVAQIDSDLQFSPEDLPKLIDLLSKDEADFVCGSRFLENSDRRSNSVPGIRLFGNHGVNWYASVWAGQFLTDVLSGIKVWKKEVTESFSMESDDYCYEVEMVMKAIRKGFRVKEVAVTTEARKYGKSSVNVFRTGLALAREIPKFRLQPLA